jgi:hypothetical protein
MDRVSGRCNRLAVWPASRGFVDRLRLFSGLYFTFDRAVPDDHLQIVDSRGLRQRKNVDRFDLFGKRIVELLRDFDARERAADFRFNISS